MASEKYFIASFTAYNFRYLLLLAHHLIQLPPLVPPGLCHLSPALDSLIGSFISLCLLDPLRPASRRILLVVLYHYSTSCSDGMEAYYDRKIWIEDACLKALKVAHRVRAQIIASSPVAQLAIGDDPSEAGLDIPRSEVVESCDVLAGAFAVAR